MSRAQPDAAERRRQRRMGLLIPRYRQVSGARAAHDMDECPTIDIQCPHIGAEKPKQRPRKRDTDMADASAGWRRQ